MRDQQIGRRLQVVTLKDPRQPRALQRGIHPPQVRIGGTDENLHQFAPEIILVGPVRDLYEYTSGNPKSLTSPHRPTM